MTPFFVKSTWNGLKTEWNKRKGGGETSKTKACTWRLEIHFDLLVVFSKSKEVLPSSVSVRFLVYAIRRHESMTSSLRRLNIFPVTHGIGFFFLRIKVCILRLFNFVPVFFFSFSFSFLFKVAPFGVRIKKRNFFFSFFFYVTKSGEVLKHESQIEGGKWIIFLRGVVGIMLKQTWTPFPHYSTMSWRSHQACEVQLHECLIFN